MSNQTLAAFRTWRDIGLVVTAVQSLLASGHSESDILIIDDASIDGQIGQLAEVFPEAHLRRARKGIEYCRLYNYAARYALRKGYKNLLILNSDSRGYSQGFVDSLEGGINLKRGIFIAGPAVKNFDGIFIHGCEKNKLGVKMCIPTEGYLFHITSFLSLGGFSKRLHRYVEDIDLVYRAQKFGLRGCFVPEASFEHLGNGSSRIQYFVPYFYRLRNLIWFLKARKTLSFFDGAKTVVRWAFSSIKRAWSYRSYGVFFFIASSFSIALGVIVGLLTNELEHE